jgi:tetratricopeptide (TPR) repeat protein
MTDLVGSTSLESRVGPTVADELRREHFAVLRSAIEDSGGDEVKNLGDGLMVVFASAAAAVGCAALMQQRMDRRNRGAEEQLGVRVGIALGDVSREEGDYFGMPVNEAARLCNACSGGQILTGEIVRLMVGSRSEHSFRSVGALELKGIPEPVPAFEVEWHPLEAEAAAVPVPPRLCEVPPVGYVGREAERATLEAALEQARGGSQRLVLLSGDPGMGKTRLATHLALTAHGEGDTVLYGRCEEDLQVPYQPWIEALRHYVAAGPEEILAAHVERHGGELTRLTPALAQRLPHVAAPQETDPESERYLLFGAAAGLLEEACADAPIVLILDDLHWADRPTLSLLRHVIGASTALRLLVIGTYRDSDLSRGNPLSELLAELHREQRAERIALRGLAESDVNAIMTAAAGHELDATGIALAGEVARETDGNPFFVSELLRHLVESAALFRDAAGRWRLSGSLGELGLPQSVREVVSQRVARLGEETGRVLGVAAVIGRDFDVELLGAVLELGEDDLLDRLDEATQASVLNESSEVPGRFSFAHALINHTLYEDLGTTRRARLHRRIAEALEDLCGAEPGPRVAELARHWAAARMPVDSFKARDYSRRAGELALAELAPDEAMRWFRQALELHEHEAAPDPHERCELLIGLGDAQRQAADFDFRLTLLDAAHLAQELGDGERLIRAALANSRGITSAFGVVDDERVAVLESALAVVAADDLTRRARLLALLAVELNFGGDLARRRALSDEALELARRSGDLGTLARVLVSRCIAISAPETLDERVAAADELAEIAGRLGDPVMEFWSLYVTADTRAQLGDFVTLDRQIAAMRALAERVGQPTLRFFHLFMDACRTRMRGELERGEAVAEETGATGEPESLWMYGTEVISVRLDQGRADEVLEILEQMMEDSPAVPTFRAGVAMVYWELGREEDSRRLVEAEARGRFDQMPRDQAWATGMTHWAEAAAHVGPPEALEPLYAHLHPWRDQVAWNGLTTNGSVARYVGLLASAMGRHDEAGEHFAAAAEVHERVDAPIFLARTQLDWAQSLAARAGPGDADRARELLEAALAICEARGCAALGARVEAALRGPAVPAGR